MQRVQVIITLLLLPIWWAITPTPLAAQIDEGGNFGSDVPCLEAEGRFVTTCFDDTMVTGVPDSDPALIQFTRLSEAALATSQQLGAAYGLAYEDGAVSGVQRLFIGAYAKRLVQFGISGPGAIYEYNLTSGALRLYTIVSDTTNRHAASNRDQAMGPWVGKSSLGDLIIGPDGRILYAVNLDTRQIARIDVSTPNPTTTYDPLSINFGLISSDPVVQADLRPFALAFVPQQNGDTTQHLLVGIVYAGERRGGFPTALGIEINLTTGAQSFVIRQELDQTSLGGSRFADAGICLFNTMPAWFPWGFSGGGWTDSSRVCHPQPMLTSLLFSLDGQHLLFGLRDRAGDQFYSINPPPDDQKMVLAQGDTLHFVRQTGGWALSKQANGADLPVSDSVDDRFTGPFPLPGALHTENHMGALARTVRGGNGGLIEQFVTTSITALRANTSSATWYDFNPAARNYATYIELIPPGVARSGKATNLGDVESLCTYALVGDRVWNDANANGLQDSGEVGMSGVLIELRNTTNSVVATATTDSNGTFRFALQPNKPYSIRLADSNFATGAVLDGYGLAPQDRGDDTLDSDADQISGAIVLPNQVRDANNLILDIGVMLTSKDRGTVAGRAWRDDGNGRAEAGEAGLSGVGVELWRLERSGSEKLVQSLVSGSDGSYTRTGVAAGRYRIRFTPPLGALDVPRDAAPDDQDSDANTVSNWYTPWFELRTDQTVRMDLGLRTSVNVRTSISAPGLVVRRDAVAISVGYRNDGPANAANVQVHVTLPNGLTYNNATPAPSGVSGQTLTWNIGLLASSVVNRMLTINTSVSDSAPNSLVPCTAMSTTSFGDNPADNSACTTINVARPSIGIGKTGPLTAALGDSVVYVLNYTTAGDATALGVVIRDTLDNQLTFRSANPPPSATAGQTYSWNLGALAPGAHGQITIEAVIQPTAGETIINKASVSTSTPGDDPLDNESSFTTQVVRPDVTITKSGPVQAAIGETLSYVLTYQNIGSAAALKETTIQDTLPAGLTLLNSSPAPSTISGQHLTWKLSTLAAGASGTITVRVRVEPSALSSVTNQATITTLADGDDPANNSASFSTTLVRPNVVVSKTGPAQAALGDMIIYQIRYRNTGGGSALDSSISDDLPVGVSLISANPAPSALTGQHLSWNLGTLAPNAQGSISLLVVIHPLAPASLINEAVIATSSLGDDPTDNRSSASTSIIFPPTPTVDADVALRIHSALDPDHGIYRTTGAAITWPVGEVLDFTPNLSLRVAAVPYPYVVRSRVTAWSLLSSVGRDATKGDDMAQYGCRTRDQPLYEDSKGLDGCTYRYVEDDSPPTEADLAGQAHLFWASGLPLGMRNDVYVYNLTPLSAADLTIQTRILSEVYNSTTGIKVRNSTQIINSRYTVHLAVARDVGKR